MSDRSPFAEFQEALSIQREPTSEPDLRIDRSREDRCGIPEIVYCQGKSVDAIARGLTTIAQLNGTALGTRLDPSAQVEVHELLEQADLTVDFHPESRTVVATAPGFDPPPTIGPVGLLTAGTSDWPVAAEAKLLAELCGCRVISYRDVGVAGLHRLVQPLEALVKARVDVIIVAAGMDGVLPSVVTGLVDIPVIGLPTSTGYGHGGSGFGAMTTMLQSCAPGVAVVNIDNGVGAGSMAVLIARRVAAARA